MLAPLAALLLHLTGCTAETAPVPAREGLRSTAGDKAPQDDGDVLGELSPASRGAIRRAPVPVLLFRGPWARASVVMSGPQWYAISARSGELTLSLHASNQVHHVLRDPVPPPEQDVRGRPARMTVNEGVRSIAWRERGAFYVVEVECQRAEKDPRCGEPRFVLDLAASLVEVSQ